MAWVTQQFGEDDFKVVLEEKQVRILVWGEGLTLAPPMRDVAHNQAMMLRRAARRLEEIGKGLPA